MMRGKGEGSVYQDSRGYWTGSIELPPLNGVRRRKVIRRKLKKDVLAEMVAARTQLKAEGDIPTNGETVEQWFTFWLNKVAAKNVRPNTLEGYRSVVVGHIIPTIGHVRLDKLTHADIERVTNRMTGELGLSSTYALLAHRAMAVALKTAWQRNRIGRNPAEKAQAPRKSAAHLEVLTLEEAISLLEHVASDPVAGPMWATSLLTGARRGEVIGLTWDRVTDVLDLSWQLQRIGHTRKDGRPDVPADFEYRHLKGGLYLTRPKSAKGWRIIPLVDPLKSILEGHRATSGENEWGLVFTSRGRAHPLHPSLVTRAWSQLLASMGITKNVRLHDVRHTTVDLLSLAGVPDDIIMAIVGHSTRLQTQEYKSRMDLERLKVAMEDFSAQFSLPIPGKRPAIGE